MSNKRGIGRSRFGFQLGVGLVVIAILLPAGIRRATAAGPSVEIEELRPGLLATFRDNTKPTPREVLQLEPTIALSLKTGEAPHPRLAADGGTVSYRGYLNVLRPSAYRFSALLRGKFRLTVAGKEVLSAEGKTAAPQLKEGPEVKLTAGIHPLLAEFTRLPGEARLQLFWQAAYFRVEPLPFDAVFHHSKKLPARLAEDRQAERGRFLAEEHSCISCHRPDAKDRLAQGLASRQGPDLSQIGQRTYSGWLYRWLQDPHKVSSGAVMPKLFRGDEAGRTEVYAVARYLTSLGGPMQLKPKPPKAKEQAASIKRGERLFTSVGCVVCHCPEKSGEGKNPEARSFYVLASSTGANPPYALSDLGSKTTPEQLAAFLVNPHALDPSGRMPNLLLTDKEALDLARYLCGDSTKVQNTELPAAPSKAQRLVAFKHVDPRPEELAAFQKLPDDQQWLDLGKRLVIDKGCNNCHTIAPGGNPFANVLASASFDDLKNPKKHLQGCLANDAAKRGQAPAFPFSSADRQALRQFLSAGTIGAGSPAPAHAARVTLQRFNCLACHSRDGEGGLTSSLVEELRRVEKEDNAEALSPPPLTGIGHKLRTPWLGQVLLQKGRARPWMGLRMPQFGEAHVGKLPEALASLDGTTPENKVHQVPLTPAKIEAGRMLVGKSAFGCIGCHDIAGIPNHGTRGPDLALMNQRVRYDWYRRWLIQAQRMQPGTRMPTIFPDGKTLLDKILGGSADAQAEAMWAYLSLGPTLPLPEGVEFGGKGLVLAVHKRPVVLRTFMPDAGSKAIAVGYPEGVATAFDAVTCRLAYAWTGNFLDVSPVWDNRGGAPARVLGPRFWTSPGGCPWTIHDSSEPPDFMAQAKDPAYGAPIPEGKLYTGPRLLSFEGYSTDKAGLPTFRYRLEADGTAPVGVSERPEALRNSSAVGLLRRFNLDVPAKRGLWLLAGETGQTPRILDGKGKVIAFDPKTDAFDVGAAGHRLVLPQGGERVLVLAVAKAPENARWYLQRQGGTWKAMLRLPPPAVKGRVDVHLQVWSPYRDDPAFLKALTP
jgi:mono/diheme cytochrome c family protein